ncbi:MAG: ketopantoate reductase family protein [Thermodesulfobacteriota bacterium]|nr:ketopantoate reductase family protein [Thermodesulfobacteriota bacterium]
MEITIIGAGAMGSLFGSMLAKAGEPVVFVDIWKEHVDAINAGGLGVEYNGKIERTEIKALTSVHDAPKSDLVIIFVKSYQTAEAAVQALTSLKDSGMVLTLQNGMGNADIISRYVSPERVIAGTTSCGATILGPGLIRNAGAGPTLIGLWSKNNPCDIEKIKDMFCRAGIDTRIDDNIYKVIWKKLVINVGINAVTALTGIKNGSIFDLPSTWELVRSAVTEACEVASAHGVTFSQKMGEQVFTVAKATGYNRSSMGQDVDHGRQTEINAINGAVVRLAEEKNIPVPVNATLTALVETLQNNYK